MWSSSGQVTPSESCVAGVSGKKLVSRRRIHLQNQAFSIILQMDYQIAEKNHLETSLLLTSELLKSWRNLCKHTLYLTLIHMHSKISTLLHLNSIVSTFSSTWNFDLAQQLRNSTSLTVQDCQKIPLNFEWCQKYLCCYLMNH